MVTKEQIAERQLAVLIDFENTGLKSIQWLFDQVADIGRIIVKRAYADWSVASNKRDELLELGIEAVHLFHSGGGSKNSSDIRLAIDAVELLHQSPVDTFVIVSSDSDFVPLVIKLRAAGKMVIGAGRKAIVSRTLVTSCDRYFYLDQNDVVPSAVRAVPEEQQQQQIEMLLKRAVAAASDEEGRVSGSKLNQTLQRLDPSFDYRALGYSTFKKLIEAYPWLKVIRTEGVGDVTIELDEPGVLLKDKLADSKTWQAEIDEAWSKRAAESGKSIPGPTASTSAARVLGVPKLSASPYKTLQSLLDASDYLSARWLRDKNTIIRR